MNDDERRKVVLELAKEIAEGLNLQPEHYVGMYETQLHHAIGPYSMMTILAEIVRRLPPKETKP